MSFWPWTQHLAFSAPAPRVWTLTLPFSPPDVYVFGVGPLVNQENINALASKKDKEQHVFKVKDMEDLEDVFKQMLGRKIPGGYKEVRKCPRYPKVTHTSSPPEALAVWDGFLIAPSLPQSHSGLLALSTS